MIETLRKAIMTRSRLKNVGNITDNEEDIKNTKSSAT